MTETSDQNGTVHAFDFDLLGRQTQDRVTTLGTGVDDNVQRIGNTYEVRGMLASTTSYDNPTVGSGSVLNQVAFTYNEFGQLVSEAQSHSGAVTMSTPVVGYEYADGSANTIRPTGLVYPNGRLLSYGYGSTNSIDDASSRIASLVDDDVGFTHLVDYQYLGRNTFVTADDTEPEVKWTLVSLTGSDDPDTGDIYTGLDRFGRVKDCRWYNYNTLVDAARIQYGYDRANNRIWRKDPVAEAYGAKFDELYDYDAIQRLKDMARGTLNSGETALTDETFAQCWSLDSTGNWKGFREDDTGDGTWDLVQNRSANEVNEITGIENTTGPTWAPPAYNRAGNMTTIPQPADPTNSYTATYDAWNRLVQIVDAATSDTVSEYSYDGIRRRIEQLAYAEGVLDETRHFYYNSSWQCIEERVDSSTDAERQFVWGLRYIDDILLRDRDTTADGTLDERLYGFQDGNWNVIALVDASGDVQERFAYSAYGEPDFLSASFGSRPTSSYHWQMLYAGYYHDAMTGLYCVRYRMLHPVLGTWIQRDLIGYHDSYNLYLYAMSYPYVAVDPSGLAVFVTILVTLVVVGVIFGGAQELGAPGPEEEHLVQPYDPSGGFVGGMTGASLAVPAIAVVTMAGGTATTGGTTTIGRPPAAKPPLPPVSTQVVVGAAVLVVTAAVIKACVDAGKGGLPPEHPTPEPPYCCVKEVNIRDDEWKLCVYQCNKAGNFPVYVPWPTYWPCPGMDPVTNLIPEEFGKTIPTFHSPTYPMPDKFSIGPLCPDYKGPPGTIPSI